MKPCICMCCGEAMREGGNPLSRNPNVCASCSSLADGMEESNVPELEGSEQERATSANTREGNLIEEPPEAAIHDPPLGWSG